MPRFAATRAASAAGLAAVEARGHRDADDPVGAERLDGDRRRERRVDAAGEPDDGLREAVLAHVVAGAEDERLVDLVEPVRGRRGSAAPPAPACRPAPAANSTTSRSSSKRRAAAAIRPSAAITKLPPSKTSSSCPPTGSRSRRRPGGRAKRAAAAGARRACRRGTGEAERLTTRPGRRRGPAARPRRRGPRCPRRS